MRSPPRAPSQSMIALTSPPGRLHDVAVVEVDVHQVVVGEGRRLHGQTDVLDPIQQFPGGCTVLAQRLVQRPAVGPVHQRPLHESSPALPTIGATVP